MTKIFIIGNVPNGRLDTTNHYGKDSLNVNLKDLIKVQFGTFMPDKQLDQVRNEHVISIFWNSEHSQ